MLFELMGRLLRTAFAPQCCEIQVELRKETYGFFIVAYAGKRHVANMRCLCYEDGSILICDIQHRNNEYNRGYGSAMMDKLNSYAAENGYTHIWGNLSEVDRDHQDRLHHFYQKHGFQVTVFEQLDGSYYGRIDKHL